MMYVEYKDFQFGESNIVIARRDNASVCRVRTVSCSVVAAGKRGPRASIKRNESHKHFINTKKKNILYLQIGYRRIPAGRSSVAHFFFNSTSVQYAYRRICILFIGFIYFNSLTSIGLKVKLTFLRRTPSSFFVGKFNCI